MEIDKNNIVLECCICKKRTIYRHPVFWLDVFHCRFGDFTISEEYVKMVKNIEYEPTDRKKLFKLGYYICNSCQKQEN